jgi:hypothetical protein
VLFAGELLLCDVSVATLAVFGGVKTIEEELMIASLSSAFYTMLAGRS